MWFSSTLTCFAAVLTALLAKKVSVVAFFVSQFDDFRQILDGCWFLLTELASILGHKSGDISILWTRRQGINTL